MAVIETWLRQDLNRLVSVQSLQGQVFSHDNGGNLIGVKVTRDGEPVELEGAIAGYCILPDGETINITPASGNTGIQNGNEAYVILPQLAYSVPGQISIVIKLAQGSSVTTLAACTGYVYKSRTSDEVVPPGTPIPDLQTLEEAISNANSATSRANTAAAAAENVDASMSKSGDVITITVTDRDGVTRTETLTDQSDAVEELQNAIVTKAEQNGYYHDMTVGTAEQLVSDEGVTEAVPYLYRKSGGGVEVGNREKLEKIVGGTVAWNQLIKNGNFADGKSEWGGANFTVADGVATVNIAQKWNNDIRQTLSVTEGHKYLGFFEAKMSAGIGTVSFGLVEQGTNNFIPLNETESFSTASGFLVPASSNASQIVRVSLHADGTNHIGKTFQVRRVQLFDLTQMFGSTIADYIYSLEQATAGAGVAWFRKLFPADYYPYNAGELISVSGLSEHKMVGFNQWDEEWELGSINDQTGENADGGNFNFYKRSKNYIKCLPNTNYYFKNESKLARVLFYDSDKHIISFSVNPQNTVITTPQNALYMRIRSADSVDMNDICINLSDPSRNGEYDPYEKHSYPLDSSLTLRGIPKLDSENKLYYDGDEYAPDGTVTRRYGIVDLGTLTWIKEAPGTTHPDWYTFYANISDALGLRGTYGITQVCSKYEPQNAAFWKDKACGFGNSSKNINISDSSLSSLSVNEFKAAMSGVMLVYELKTPTTEQADPYTRIQVVDPCGTEEFVSTSIVPVGHSTKYPADLVKKLEGLPWNFATLIAPTESTTTASRPYAVGSYLILSNTLYKVTSAIANGGTITPGTNVTATTIMAELAALA